MPTAGLWRLSKRPASEPYWARGAQSRFDDPAGATPGAATFGVLYVGQDPETAFCESVIHENSLFLNGAFVVSRAGLVARSLVGFKHPTKPSMTLADLTGAGLKALGLNNDISAGDNYCISQAWAAAIHVARPELDGIRYVSRQRNDAFCYALFDRSGVVGDGAAPMPPALLNALCLRFNVRVVA
ncbi:MAG: RES family NAD+ phosphorylase [Betaproteobacteria bacterium]